MMEVRVLIQEIRVLIGRFPAAARFQVLLRAVHPRRAAAHRDAWSHELGILVHRPPGSRLLAWARIAVKTTCVRLRSSSTLSCARPEACYLVAFTRVSRVAVHVGRTPFSQSGYNGFHADSEVTQCRRLPCGNCRPTIDRGV